MTAPDDIDMMIRMASALACGAAIGLERDWRRLPTGYRTLALVCLGSCVAVIAALKAGDSDGFSRVAQGVVTGIGFLGGGVILQKGNIRDVKGLTTAAAIWLTAGIGLLCGIGELKMALFATALAVTILMLNRVFPPDKTPTGEDEKQGGAKP